MDKPARRLLGLTLGLAAACASGWAVAGLAGVDRLMPDPAVLDRVARLHARAAWHTAEPAAESSLARVRERQARFAAGMSGSGESALQ